MGEGEDALGREPAAVLVHGGEGGHHLVHERDLVVAQVSRGVLVGDGVQQLPQQRRAVVGVAGRAARAAGWSPSGRGRSRRWARARARAARPAPASRGRPCAGGSAGSAGARRGCGGGRAGGDAASSSSEAQRRRKGSSHQVSPKSSSPVVATAAARRSSGRARRSSARRRRGRARARPSSRSTRCAAAGSRARGVTVPATGGALRRTGRETDGGEWPGERCRARPERRRDPRRARDGRRPPAGRRRPGLAARPRAADGDAPARRRPDDAELAVGGPRARHRPSAAGRHDEAHAETGARAVRAALGERVAGLVALHVEAKRYLVATDGGYGDVLADDSVVSLVRQGGAMTRGRGRGLLGPAVGGRRRWPCAGPTTARRSRACEVPGLARWASAAARPVRPGRRRRGLTRPGGAGASRRCAACTARWCHDRVGPVDAPVSGRCDARFGAVREQFGRNFAERGEIGAALCILVDGRTVVDLAGGWTDATARTPWRGDTLVNFYSVGKAFVALLALQLVDAGSIALDDPIARGVARVRGGGQGGDDAAARAVPPRRRAGHPRAVDQRRPVAVGPYDGARWPRPSRGGSRGRATPTTPTPTGT